MDKFENRRQRLLQLLESPRFHGRGAKAEIARLAGIDMSYLSRMLYPADKDGSRTITEGMAEKLETGLNLAKGWFDMPLHDEPTNVIPYDNHDPVPDDVVLVHEYALRLSGGPGSTPLLDEIEESRAVPFMRDWLREMGIPPNKAKRFKVWGDSMVPTVGAGDMVLVDTSDTNVRDGLVYALSYGEDLRIKRLFTKLDGTLILHSDNPTAVPRDEELSPELAQQYIRIIGRVRDRSGASGLD